MTPPRPAMWRHGGRVSSLLHAAALALLVAAATLATPARAQELCQTLKTCKMVKGECDRTKEACPPCIYLAVGGGYQCFEKTSETNTCPYTGVIYDCAGVNYGSTGKPSSSSSSSTTNTTASPSLSSSPSNSTSTATTADAAATAKSPMLMYAAIGGGALLVIILLVFVVMRRRRRGRNMPKFADSPQVFNTKRGAKNATANTPYSNMPNTSKGPGQYQRKYSDPVLLESSAVMMGAHQASSDYSGNTATDSLDGMLAMDNTPPPAVLGDPLPRTRSKRGFSSGFKRHNSGGSSKRNSSTYDMKAPPVKAGPNVFGEYLKMKQEFDDDGMSDYGSDMMSLDRFSVTSSSTVGGGGHGHGGHNVLAMSITDSEYQADLMRSRTESECFSEMSYNDEKYSFSDDTDSVLAASIVRQPPKKDKEVEI